jgi:ribosomal protein L14E/L6E/L27E
VTILDLDDFQTGRVVISRKGKDKGTFYAVIGMDRLKNRVYVADGRRHSVFRPKPKNPKHLQMTNWSLPRLEERLRDSSKNNDEWLRQQLLNLIRDEGAQIKRG